MTFLAARKEMTSSAPMWQPHIPDSNASTGRVLEYVRVSEDELLTAARGSDGRAFAELCSRHSNAIKNRMFRMLRNREDADDVLQEAIYKAFVHLHSFRGTCRFSVWLTQIAINSAFMLMRKRRSRSEVSYDQPTDPDQETQTWEFPDRSPNPEQMYVKRQAIERMLVAVNRLPPRDRGLVQQFHGTEQSLQETADQLGIKVGTAKSRLLRARMKIRSNLKKQKISFADACH